MRNDLPHVGDTMPEHAYCDTFGMSAEQVNKLAAMGDVTLTEFMMGGKRMGGDIIGPVRDRGFPEKVVGKLIATFDNEDDCMAALGDLTG